MRTQTVRIIAGQISSLGVPITGSEFSSTRNSAGNYTLRFPPDFRIRSITAINASGSLYVAAVITGQTVNIVTYNTSAVQADAPVHFTAVGAA